MELGERALLCPVEAQVGALEAGKPALPSIRERSMIAEIEVAGVVTLARRQEEERSLPFRDPVALEAPAVAQGDAGMPLGIVYGHCASRLRLRRRGELPVAASAVEVSGTRGQGHQAKGNCKGSERHAEILANRA